MHALIMKVHFIFSSHTNIQLFLRINLKGDAVMLCALRRASLSTLDRLTTISNISLDGICFLRCLTMSPMLLAVEQNCSYAQ